MAIFKCDNCQEQFERPASSIDPKRLSNDYTHVCPNCDPKRFAQKRGVESRKFWNIPADADIDITSI